MVNAYTLTFAVLLLTGAALGDRFGRRRMFIIGLVDLHRSARRAAALAPIERGADPRPRHPGRRRRDRDAADPDDPVGGGSAAASRARARARGAASAAWRSRSARVVGGAIAQGLNWHWIFWLNVPIGIVAVDPRLLPARGDRTARKAGSTSPGLGLASAGLLGLVWGVDPRQRPRLDRSGRSSRAIGVGAALLLAASWPGSARPSNPMLPLAHVPQPRLRGREQRRRC